jgi:hypothetical protein
MHITVDRTYFSETTSSGILRIDGEYFCEELTDAARPFGVKVPGKTCLPPGQYHVTITPSVRFKRPMLLLYTNAKDLSCEHGGIRFTGIRMHGGETHLHTEGCEVLGFDRLSPERIKRDASGALLQRVKGAMDVGETVSLTIRNVVNAVDRRAT